MAEPRARTRIPTAFCAESLSGTGKVKNVSESGLFVDTRAIPDPGESIELELRAPGHPLIQLTGLVWWTTKDLQRLSPRSGFGLRLLEDDELYRCLVASLL